MDKYEREYLYECEWLGIILKDRSFYKEKTIQTHHFQNETNQKLYQVIDSFLKENIPLDSNAWFKLSHQELVALGGKEHIEECKRMAIHMQEENFKHIEKEIQTFYIGTQMIQKMTRIEKKDFFDLEEIRKAMDELNQTSEGISQKRKTHQEKLHAFHQKNKTMKNGLSGIDTGYQKLNQMTNGAQLKDLWVIAGRPSMGKSAISINLMLEMAKIGNAVSFIPAETGVESVYRRSCSIIANLPVSKMKNPLHQLDKDQMRRYEQAMNTLASLPIDVEEIHDITEIRQYVRERKKQVGEQKLCVIIDHLGHLHDQNRYSNKNHEYESYCKQLKDIARDYNVCVILLSQLSREVEKREDKRPMNSDLRDSGAIEQIADCIMFLYRENYYLEREGKEPNPKDILEMIVSKNRDGSIGMIPFLFVGSTNRLYPA